MRDANSFLGWLAGRTPGQRLQLMLVAIGVVVGGLALIPGPSTMAPPAVHNAASVVAEKEAIGSPGERPGSAGRAVKTITVAAKGDGAAPAAATATTSEPSVVAPAATPAAIPAASPAASPAAAGSEASAPTTAPRVAQVAPAPAPAAAPPAAAPTPSPEARAKTTPLPATALKTLETKMNIQDVKSPGGIRAWLVEEQSIPLVAVRFVFEGGSSQDPAGKEGLGNFLTAMMDEGAGDLNAAQFQERMEEIALRMSYQATRDGFYGSFETLTANKEQAVELLKLALNKPRFDADAVERIRKQLLANLAFAEKNPQTVAGRVWYERAFEGHPYARNTTGTRESIERIQADDLRDYLRRIAARDTLRVVAVGAIDAKTLGELIDRVFGDLPAKAELTPVPMTKPSPAQKLAVVEMDVPQSVVQFGMPGLARKDPDFIPAFVMNQILGGGGFASRLTEEVREKRGLAYSVYSYIQPYRHTSTFGGGVATRNEAVKESVDVIRAELKRMATEGPTETELANAKSFLTGSFALRFDTNSKIASQLLWMLYEDMGIDYVDRRNGLIDAVTMEDVRRAAQRVLVVDDLFVTVVGRPVGLGG